MLSTKPLVVVALVVTLLTAAAQTAVAAPAIERFARVPDPGHPEGVVVVGSRVFTGTADTVQQTLVPTSEPSRLVWFDRSSGALEGSVAVTGQRFDKTRALLGLAADRKGRIYAAERIGLGDASDGVAARILRFTVKGRSAVQETYATIPDVPACGAAVVQPCSPTRENKTPLPNSLAFDRDGALYVSDSSQAAVWRVPTRGGTGRLWFADARWDSIFGPNGMAIDASRRHLYVTSTADVGQIGQLWRLSLSRPALDTVYTRPGALFDGIALGEDRGFYIGLMYTNQIAHLDPSGRPVELYPSVGGPLSPLQGPSNMAFDGAGSMFVTNYDVTGMDTSKSYLSRLGVGDRGLPLVRP
jgi:hypothetical protein